MANVDISNLMSETRNERTMHMDDMSVRQMLMVMNEEDARVPIAISRELDAIEKTIYLAVETLKAGGRVIYVGSGTSGRIGVMDAVECAPTFGCTDEFMAVLAGGSEAFIKAKEGAEDDEAQAVEDMKEIGLKATDMVIGIAASGRTPHTVSAVSYARKLGCHTAAIATNKNSALGKVAEVAIEVVTGPEVLTGSTRLKSATAQKMICNMISTISMKEIGKTYENLMVDMKPTNLKLIERARRMVMTATGCTYEKAEAVLSQCSYHTKTAIVMLLCHCDAQIAERILADQGGFVAKACQAG